MPGVSWSATNADDEAVAIKKELEKLAVTCVDVQVGKFNSLGMDSITGRALETGQWWVAKSTSASFNSSLWASWSTSVTWVDVQVGDFNGDGLSDITGRALQNGQWWTGTSASELSRRNYGCLLFVSTESASKIIFAQGEIGRVSVHPVASLVACQRSCSPALF